MEYVILYLLLATLLFNFINIGIVVSLAKYLTQSDATSESKAVSIEHNLFWKMYLYGPMVPWSNIHRTDKNEYWVDTTNWTKIKIAVFFGFSVVLFFNIFLIYYFLGFSY